jgi:hypothetical protein
VDGFIDSKSELIYNDSGKIIAKIYWKDIVDIITYSVRQVGENKAELYCLINRTITFIGEDLVNNVKLEKDSTLTIGPDLEGFIYLENNKVFCQHKHYTGETPVLMYDFNLKQNDTFNRFSHMMDIWKYTVASIDSVVVGNEHRKRYNFTAIQHTNLIDFSIIEGIGTDLWQFFYTIIWPVDHDNETLPCLLSVYHKDKLIYKTIYCNNEE